MKISLLPFLIIMLSFSSASGNLIHVPVDYPTIQAAIVNANSGDTVIVSPGTYYENINFRGKDIVLTSLYYLDQDTTSGKQFESCICYCIYQMNDFLLLVLGVLPGGRVLRFETNQMCSRILSHSKSLKMNH